MTELGRTARQVREKLGMTQRAAAVALGVSSVHLSNVERGRTLPSASLIARFSEVYGIDIYVLSYCEGSRGGGSERVCRARRKLAEALLSQIGEAG